MEPEVADEWLGSSAVEDEVRRLLSARGGAQGGVKVGPRCAVAQLQQQLARELAAELERDSDEAEPDDCCEAPRAGAGAAEGGQAPRTKGETRSPTSQAPQSPPQDRFRCAVPEGLPAGLSRTAALQVVTAPEFPPHALRSPQSRPASSPQSLSRERALRDELGNLRLAFKRELADAFNTLCRENAVLRESVERLELELQAVRKVYIAGGDAPCTGAAVVAGAACSAATSAASAVAPAEEDDPDAASPRRVQNRSEQAAATPGCRRAPRLADLAILVDEVIDATRAEMRLWSTPQSHATMSPTRRTSPKYPHAVCRSPKGRASIIL
jgi:hypothetical protein